jgi:hypothetical protein
VESDRPRPSTDPLRLTVPEAAEVLGVTVDAVRGRIRRGTLDSERESGTVYVWIDLGEVDRPGPSETSRRPSDGRTDELLEALRGQVHDLREQLQAERQGHAEARRLLAAALERIPAIEAPQEASEAAETVEEEAEPRPSTGGAQEGVQRPWWRRVLGR